MDTPPAQHPRPPHSRSFRLLAALAACIVLLGGCASSGGVGGLVDRTLETVGLREAEPQWPRDVPLQLMAGENLNAGTGGRGLALVVKVYQLRKPQRFEQAPFDAFLDETRERAALGDDLLSVNEVILTPGARQKLTEQVDENTGALAVVALFQAPAANRWRLVFDPKHEALDEDGITIGLHACAMTTSHASLLTRVPGGAASLASVRCEGARR